MKSDEALMAAHRNGDTTAFEQLVRRHGGSLLGYLTRMSGNRDRAEDFFQETFKRVHQKGHTFNVKGRFKPWLFAVAANKARDALRARKRRRMVSIDASVSLDQNDGGGRFVDLMASDEASPVEKFSQAEAAERVREVVATMPDHLREVLLLAYFQRLAYKEIAEIVGVPLGTVKSRLHTALGSFTKLWARKTSEKPKGDLP